MLDEQIPTEKWSTELCQCGGFEGCASDWACALFCTGCIGPIAQENVDGTPCFFSLLFNPPCFNRNVVRRRYNIVGDDGEDALMTTFLLPCVLRQTYTESKKRGRVPSMGIYKWGPGAENTGGRWMKGLCECTPGTFCYALFFPQCISASTRQKFDGSACAFNAFCSTPCGVYNQVRRGYALEGSSCVDAAAVHCLYPCALQRAYEEVLYKYLQALVNKAKQKVEVIKKCCGCC